MNREKKKKSFAFAESHVLTTNDIQNYDRKASNTTYSLSYFACHLYVIRVYWSVVCTTRISSVWNSYVLICHPYVTRMHLYCIRMYLYVIPISVVCTRVSSVCHSYVLVRYPYVSRMYSYVICITLVCTWLSSVCYWYMVLQWTLDDCLCFIIKMTWKWLREKKNDRKTLRKHIPQKKHFLMPNFI